MEEQSRNKDETYSETEVDARLKNELPQWYLEKGWI